MSTEYNSLKSSKTWSSTNILNRDPMFKDPSVSLSSNFTENYRLKANSPMKGKADFTNSPSILLQDADGVMRLNPSSLGCYE